MTLGDLQPVDTPETVGQCCPETSDLVVLIINFLLQGAHPVSQHLVLVLNHIVAGGHAGGGDGDGRGRHEEASMMFCWYDGLCQIVIVYRGHSAVLTPSLVNVVVTIGVGGAPA